MLIRMLKSYMGIAGCYIAGIKYELPEVVVKKLPEDSFEGLPVVTKQAVSRADKQARPGKGNYKTKGS